MNLRKSRLKKCIDLHKSRLKKCVDLHKSRLKKCNSNLLWLELQVINYA